MPNLQERANELVKERNDLITRINEINGALQELDRIVRESNSTDKVLPLLFLEPLTIRQHVIIATEVVNNLCPVDILCAAGASFGFEEMYDQSPH